MTWTRADLSILDMLPEHGHFRRSARLEERLEDDRLDIVGGASAVLEELGVHKKARGAARPTRRLGLLGHGVLAK